MSPTPDTSPEQPAEPPRMAPLSILVLSDLAAGPDAPRERLRLDKTTLDELVARLCGTVRLRVGPREVELRLQALRDFSATQVAAQLPAGSAAGGSPAASSLVDQVLAGTPAGNPAAAALLGHPEFVRLERGYRSLKFLLDHVSLDEGIRVEVLASDRAGAARVLRERVRDPELEAPSDEPVSLIVADYEFGPSSADLGLLAELAELGMDLCAPVVTGVADAFFAGRKLGELSRMNNVRSLFEGDSHAEWRAFRKAEPSRWVALGMNRFLLRDGEPPLYGNPAWLLAVIAARQFAELKWCAPMSGPQVGAIKGLPVRMIEAAGRQANLPVEAILPEQTTSDLGDAGLVPVVARPNTDAAVVLRAPTAHEHERWNKPAETEQSRLRTALEHQLFVGRLAQQLESLARAVPSGVDPQGIESLFEAAIAGMLKLGGPAAEDAALAVKVVPSPEREDRYDVIVQVRPGRLLLGGRVSGVLLTLRVPR